MRYLNFTLDEEGKKRFDICYQGLTDPAKTYSNRKERKLVGRIMKKFKVLGTPSQVGRFEVYTLNVAGVVSLEDAEYEKLFDAVDKTAWIAPFSETVEDTQSWLESCPDIEPKDRPAAEE